MDFYILNSLYYNLLLLFPYMLKLSQCGQWVSLQAGWLLVPVWLGVP